MRMLVTGGAGFIGSHVAEALAAAGHEVLVLDDFSGGFLENVPGEVHFERKSVLEPLDDVFASFKPEVVYHLAAYAAEGLSHHIPVFNYQNNLVGTANVLAAAYRANSRRFVFTSSIAVYGHPNDGTVFDEETACNPCDPYGAAKYACETHLKCFFSYHGSPSYTIFRPHNVFGPKQNISDPYRNVVGIFMKMALEGRPMPVFGDGTQTRSFSYISTVARCIAESGTMQDTENLTINIGGDQPMSVAQLAREIARVMQVKPDVQWLPARQEVVHAHCSHALARTLFKEAYAKEVPIQEGLMKMAEFVRTRPVPPETECPARIEISDHLPPSWLQRLQRI
jgi:UDP-glucose 4-epimerase